MELEFYLNQKKIKVKTPPDRRVVDLLREDLNLTGTKEGCGSGECGACTTIIDGETRLSCLMLAAQLEGHQVTTIEGLNKKEPGLKEPENGAATEMPLHPLQQAFIEGGAIQCGFCTPGMVLTAHELLKKNPNPNENEIRTAISGNLCRCTGYQKIVESIRAAAVSRDGVPE